MPTGKQVTAVIPARNEARNIGWVLDRMPPAVTRVILVDGLSTDGTVDVARHHRPDIVVVSQLRPGKGAALRAGFDAAGDDIVVMLDADGSMDPCEIPAFVDLVRDGYQFVKGSRFVGGGGTADMTVLRNVGNRALLALANGLFGSAYTDLCYGYCAFDGRSLRSLGLTADGFEIETQLVLRSVKAGLVIAEAPSFEYPRRSGDSNLHTFRDGWRVLRTIVAERFRATNPGRRMERPDDAFSPDQRSGLRHDADDQPGLEGGRLDGLGPVSLAMTATSQEDMVAGR
jgi:glycosyltransferase involved in cell wall biosynthesis